MEQRLYKLKKGLNLRLKGEPEQRLSALPRAAVYAVCPGDFTGIVPRLSVKEGDRVLAGDTLFTDKATELVRCAAPVSGVVKAIVRGERRRILRIEIAADKATEYRDYGVQKASEMRDSAVKDLLLQSGLFAFIRQRPYDVVADPTAAPKSIFVSTFSKMPLAADFSYVAQGQEEAFKAGIAALARIAPIHVGISPEQINSPLLPLKEAQVSVFDGPNPAGCVGVHINHISPVNKGETVWTVGAEAVIFIGRLFLTGHVDLTRRIAVGGSRVKAPQYVETLVGTPLSAIYADQINAATPGEHIRIINGNPLVGEQSSLEGYLAAFATETCALPEGDEHHELFGWIMPRLQEFSANHSYLSWILGRKKRYDLDCRIKGGERHMIMSGEYDAVFPMDIFPAYLIKALIAGDIDRQEALGIYEVAPEDFAVAEFVCSSKLELQRIVREGLDQLRKENA